MALTFGCFALFIVLTLGACAGPPVGPPARRTVRSAPMGALVGSPPASGRLPSDVRPLHYRLQLNLDPRQLDYDGKIEIELAFERPRNILWLNGRGLGIQSPVLRLPDGTDLEGRVLDVGADGFFAVGLPELVGPGTGSLRLRFWGSAGERCTGLYQRQREADRYIFSQLEATHARDVFPGFDEPGYKTPFDVSVVAPERYVALSNAREVQRVRLGPRTKTVFATTPPLPTYLLAFAVGPFDVVEAPPIPPNPLRPSPLQLRAATYRGGGERARWALAQMPGLLDDLERYAGSGYPFDKLDFIATPCEPPSAMEHPGAITIHERLLMERQESWTDADRRVSVRVIAHELAHQWFGNLVTPRWWTAIWLNESFAEWLEVATVARQRPADRADVGLAIEARRAMSFDALSSAKAIRRAMVSEAEIHASFDALTYDKGGAVLGMVEHLAGAEGFRRGLRGYLTRHRGGVATADDLFAALEGGVGSDAVDVLRSFLDQPGVPLVEARVDCGGPRPALRVRQSRYLPLGRKDDPPQTWRLPVCARYPEADGTRVHCEVLREAEGSIALPTARCPAWVMPNADGVGYYRWRLPPDDLRRLAAAVPSLSTRERISFVDAVQAGWEQATLAPRDALELLAARATDDEPEVATALVFPLSQARLWLSADADAVRNLDDFARRVYAAPLSALGPGPKSGESPERARARDDLQRFFALVLRDPAVRTRLAAPGREHLAGKPGALPPDPLALRLAVADGGAPMFEAALEHFAAGTPNHRWHYINALAAAERPELVARAHALAFDKRLLHSEVWSLLSALMANPALRDDTWGWLVTNLSALRKRALDEHYSSFPFLAENLCDARRADELVARFDDLDPTRLTAAEPIRACAARRDAMIGPLRGFFARPPR